MKYKTNEDTSKGTKHDQGKPMLSLVPLDFIAGVGEAFTYGATQKYDPHNFKKGIQTQRLLDAALRHIYLEISGIPIDTESNLEHWKLAGASIAMYAYMKRHHPELDDRYIPTVEEQEKLIASIYGK